MPSPDPVRVLIVDDDDRFALALAALLEEEPRVEVVGRAANGNQAVRFVTELKPDVVTMDLEMPMTNGVEATRAIVGSIFAPRVIVVSGSETAQLLDEALAAGAIDYVPKTAALTRLIPAILAAAAR